jgi:hypothetical protein
MENGHPDRMTSESDFDPEAPLNLTPAEANRQMKVVSNVALPKTFWI